MARTFRPEQLTEALQYLQAEDATVMAGGTDIYPAHVGRVLGGSVVDIGALAELNGTTQINVGSAPVLELGAGMTWSSLVRRTDPLLRLPLLDALAMAGAEVGGVQIQNRGTIAGNLCNASPAADGVPALLALDASLVLVSAAGKRVVRLADFITGPRQTALRQSELVRSIRIPLPSAGQSHSAFLKLGQRRYLVISAVMVAARLDWQGDRLIGAAVAVGSCGPVASRLPYLEKDLVNRSATEVLEMTQRRLPAACLQPLAPISDLRGSNQYRLDAADILVRRVLSMLAARPGQNNGPDSTTPGGLL